MSASLISNVAKRGADSERRGALAAAETRDQQWPQERCCKLRGKIAGDWVRHDANRAERFVQGMAECPERMVEQHRKGREVACASRVVLAVVQPVSLLCRKQCVHNARRLLCKIGVVEAAAERHESCHPEQ